MCIIVLKPEGVKVDKETLETCFEHNSDGCGFAMNDDDGKLVVWRALDFETLWKEYEKMGGPQQDKLELWHFRIKSIGRIGLPNVHPFIVPGQRVVVAHNGTISKFGNTEVSDTREFVEGLLSKLPTNWWRSDGILELIKHTIGYSKMVFTDGFDYTIVNEDKGIWENGIWYSNSSFRKYKVYTVGYDHYTGEYYDGVRGYKPAVYNTLKDDIANDKWQFLTLNEFVNHFRVFNICENRYELQCQGCGNELDTEIEFYSAYCLDCIRVSMVNKFKEKIWTEHSTS